MKRFLTSRSLAFTVAFSLCQLSFSTADAQQVGRSRLLPNPVSSGGNRVNIRDPQRGQGGGQFNDPRSGERTHAGVDLTASNEAPVQAVDNGIVIRSVNTQQRTYSTAMDPPLPVDNNGAGNRVTVRHQDGTTSSYFHLTGNQQPSIGERVVEGQVIGAVGRTGNVPSQADTHLHFEYRDRSGTPVRPEIQGVSSTQSTPVQSNYTEPTGRTDLSLAANSNGPSVTPRHPGATPQTASFRLR
ncbi:MAG: M23 family metallopeptidase [Pirellulaceae bacterium]|nr:M23 family metallopeptidase [Pirellulaceae bacterium]